MPNETPQWWARPGFDWDQHESARNLEHVLSRAFDSKPDLAEKILAGLSISWPVRDGAPTCGAHIWRPVLEEMVLFGRLFDFVQSVLQEPVLEDFHASIWNLTLGDPGGAPAAAEGELQSVAAPGLGWQNSVAIARKVRDSLQRVAMIQIAGRPAGTGFLVGRNILLTAAHVIDKHNLPPRPSGTVTATFDFVPNLLAATADTGHKVKVVGFEDTGSLPTLSERQGRSYDWNASDSELDFLLLRLERPVADEVKDGSPRGYYTLDDSAYNFLDKEQLEIPQHPLGHTQVTSPAVGRYSLNDSRTRVRYYTNTLQGSSGAPVIEPKGGVVALHHYGAGNLNQGVPIHKIAAKIAKDGISIRPYRPPSTAAFSFGTSSGSAAPAGSTVSASQSGHLLGTPLDFSQDATAKFESIVGASYRDESELRSLVAKSGLNETDIDWSASYRNVLRQVLGLAQDEDQLAQVAEVVLGDGGEDVEHALRALLGQAWLQTGGLLRRGARLARTYSRWYETATGHRPVWLPLSDRVELGDYGRLKHGTFERIGNIREFGVNFGERSRNTAELNLGVAHRESNSETEATFTLEQGMLVQTQGAYTNEIQSVREVADALRRNKDASRERWRLAWSIVHRVYACEFGIVVLAPSPDTMVVASGEKAAIDSFVVGGAPKDLMLTGRTKDTLVAVGPGALGMDTFRIGVGGRIVL